VISFSPFMGLKGDPSWKPPDICVIAKDKKGAK
jgi:hypothetical protein